MTGFWFDNQFMQPERNGSGRQVGEKPDSNLPACRFGRSQGMQT
jgi:hypothetical protein